MVSSNRSFRLSGFAALVVAATATNAQADCVAISSVPYSISQSGSYCVTADLSAYLVNSGEAIAVWASNVDIDFQGHLITNPAPLTAGTVGVRLMSWSPVNNVTVRNGRVSRFDVGIDGVNINSGNLTANLTIDAMTVSLSRTAGIRLQGTNLRVTNSTVSFVSGATDVRGIALMDNNARNMTASNRAVVQGNFVLNIRSSGKLADGTTASFASATGIAISGFPDILIRDNRVSNIWMPNLTPDWSPTGYARAVGISVDQVAEPYRIAGLIVQDNSVWNLPNYVNGAKTNSAGIVINNPGDHAIVSGSAINMMNTGIETSIIALPGTPPVLLLDNSISSATTPTNGGVRLPN